MFKYWYLKLFALILAILLWFVAWGLSSGTKEIKQVPIKVKNLHSNLAYALETYEVNLKVVAKNKELNSLTSENFEATLDLQDWDRGTYNQKIEIKSPIGVEVISVNPDNFMVRIEERKEKEVGLVSRIEGLPADGYLVGNAKIEPERAVASGPQSEIETLNRGTIRIALNGEKEGFTRNLEIVAFDSQGKIIRSISFKPPKVKVTAAIFSGTNNKAVGIKPKIAGNPLADFWVSSVQTSPSTIIINSDSEKLNSIDSIETSLYDITGLKANKESKVTIVLPPGVSSVENIKEVTILIEISSLETTRELYGSVGFKNTEAPHRVVMVNPETIRVVVSGSTKLIRTLTSSQVSIEIDLKGREPGTYRLELNKDNIKVPEGIGAISFLPNVIEVTIE